MKGYKVTEYRSPGSSSGRGLVFRKYSAEEMKKQEAERTPEKEFFYTGDVGSVRGEKGHDEYEAIAKQIMKEITNKDEANEEWPATVDVDIKEGKKETTATWTQHDDDEADFRNGYF